MGYISNWRKFEVKNDTLYHIYFGELGGSAKAKISFSGKDGFELYYPKDSVTYTFKKINDKINWNVRYDEFWNTFNNRRINSKCFFESEKTN